MRDLVPRMSALLRVLRGRAPILVVLAPIILLLPSPGFATASAWGALAALSYGLAMLLTFVLWPSLLFEAGRGALMWLIGVSAAIAASLLFAPSFFASAVGTYLDPGSALAVFLCACSVVFAARLLDCPERRRGFLNAFILMSGVGAALQGVNILAGYPMFGPGYSAFGSEEMLIYIAGAACIAWSSLGIRGGFLTLCLAAAAALSLCAVLLLGGTLFFVVTLGLFAAVGLSALTSGEGRTRVALRAGVGAIAVVLLFMRLSGVSLHSEVAEVKPSAETTAAVASKTLMTHPGHLLFGIGPGRFDRAWLEEGGRPVAVNRTEFWNDAMVRGHDYLLTRLAEYGFPLLLLTALPLLLLSVRLAIGVSPDMQTVTARAERAAFLALVLYALFTLATTHPSTPFLLLLAMLIGASLATLGSVSQVPSVSLRQRELSRLAFVLLFAGTAYLAYLSVPAYLRLDRAIAAASAGDHVSAVAEMRHAANPLPTPQFLVQASSILQLAADAVVENEALAEDLDLRDLLEDAEQKAKAAADIEDSFTAHVALGNAYLRMHILGRPGAAAQAREQYDAAANLSPYHPLPPFLIAQLSYHLRNGADAAKFARQALLLKPDYAEAARILSALETH